MNTVASSHPAPLLRESFIELPARERARSLLDAGTFRELLGPFDRIESPWLPLQGVVCQADDGCVIARGTIDSVLNLNFTIGDFWILTASLAWAIYSVWLKHRPSSFEPTARLAAIIGGGIIVLIPFFAWESVAVGMPSFDTRTLATMALLALVPGFGAYQAYGYVQRVLGAGPTGLIMYLSPIYTALFGALLLGETLHLYHLVGALLVLPGIWLATRAGKPS